MRRRQRRGKSNAQRETKEISIYDWQLEALREKGTLQLLVGDFDPSITTGKHFYVKNPVGERVEIYIESIVKGDRITTVVVRLA